MKTTTVVYDVSHIRHQKAGIGRLATIQLQGILALDHERSYVLYGWDPHLDIRTIQAMQRPGVRIAVREFPGIVRRWYWNYLRMPTLERLLGPFSIFHSSEPLLPPLKRNTKAVIAFNDSAYFKFPHFYNPTTARKWDYLYRRTVRNADAVLVLSENTRADLIEMMHIPSERIHVVRPPTDPIFSGASSPDDVLRVRSKFSLPDKFLLFVGTLEPRKNIPRLVKAFELFSQLQSELISLVIVGRKGWLFEDILKTINESSVRERIRLLDYVADEDLAVIYRLAIMFVFPSLYEGHGYPVVEAMASGTPVITSNNSSLREIGQGAALLVNADNIEELADAMVSVYRDQNLRERLSAKGKTRAREFSLERASKAILAVYQSLE